MHPIWRPGFCGPRSPIANGIAPVLGARPPSGAPGHRISRRQCGITHLGRVAGPPGAAHQRLAAVDVGSNTVHVLVADAREQDGEGRLDDVAHYVETPQLGAEVTRTSRIGTRKAEETIAALRSVLASASRHGYGRLVAGATAGVRRAAD